MKVTRELASRTITRELQVPWFSKSRPPLSLAKLPKHPKPLADTLPSHCSASPRQAGCTSYIPIRQPDPHGTASPSMTCLVSRPGSSHRLGAPFGPRGKWLLLLLLLANMHTASALSQALRSVSSHQPHTAGTICEISHLADEKLRHREIKTLGQGHQESEPNRHALVSRAVRRRGLGTK